MATASEVAEVRKYTDEPTDDDYTDPILEGLIDDSDVYLASATIWRWKMAKYAKLVDVSEAGSSHAFSELWDHAKEMVEHYTHLHGGTPEGQTETAESNRAKVSVIERE